MIQWFPIHLDTGYLLLKNKKCLKNCTVIKIFYFKKSGCLEEKWKIGL